MGRKGAKKHLKTLAAPHHWMLPKTAGVHSFRPRSGPHKLRESMPLAVFIRNRLKYALNGKEVQKIMMSRAIAVDGKVRTDSKYPAGFMDVISIEKSNEHFRLIYDTKGRYQVNRISAEEASYKLCKVQKVMLGKNNVPFLVTHDGRTIRYPNPECKPGSNSIPVTSPWSSAEEIWAESVLSPPEIDTLVDLISFTSRILPVTLSLPELLTSSLLVKVTKLWLACPEIKVSGNLLLKKEMLDLAETKVF